MADLELISVRGWEVLRLSTDQVCVDIVPALGGTIVSLRRRSDDTKLLWQTPWGLRQRGAQSLPGNSEEIMMDSFAGGWQSLFPNGGETSHAHGAEWGADGEARVAPFDWERTGHSVIMTTRLVRSPFQITKIISVRGGQVEVGETVRNVGGEQIETMWGSQVIFGPPLLSSDTVVDAAATLVHPEPSVSEDTTYDDITPWPRTMGHDSMINLRTVPGADSGQTRQAYLGEFSRPLVRLSNPALDLAVELEWDLAAWPHLWYSLEAARQSGFPWFRKGYFLALTPCTSWPAHGLYDARQISSSTLWIEPGAEISTYLTLTVRSLGVTPR